MHMALIRNILTSIKMIRVDSLFAMCCTQELQKVAHELTGEVGHITSWIFADNEHLSHVGFGLDMAFETVLVTALFLADLAVPSKALETLRFLLVGDGLGSSGFSSWHSVWDGRG